MAVVLRSLALLLAAGASAGLFLGELSSSSLASFVSGNTVTIQNRHHLILGMATGAAVMAVVGLATWWRSPRLVQRWAHLLAPGILLGFVPPLCLPGAWTSPLHVAIGIGVFLLLGERLFRLAFAAGGEAVEAASVFDDPPPVAASAPSAGAWERLAGAPRQVLEGLGALLSPGARRRLPGLLVGAGVVGYAIYMSVFTLRMHGRFQTYGYDLGQYDNIFWSTLHGHPLRDGPLNLTKNWHELSNHAELSVFFFLPFYAIHPGAATLLVIQSCVLGLGAIPLYRFAARRLPRSYAATIAIAYLFYPPMHGLQFYDFHFQPIAATFVLAVIDFVDARRYWLCAIAFIVALGCREDVPVGLAILGAFLALSGYRVWPGIILAISASAYFVVMRFVIMPLFGPGWFQGIYKGLLPMGAPNFGGVIATLISNPVFTFVSVLQPEKLRYALQILLPLAFLPVRRSYLIVSIIPGALFTLLTTEYGPTIDIGFQYSGHFIPYVFPAAVLCIATFGGAGAGLARRRAALAALISGTILTGVHWGAIPPRPTVHGGFSAMTMNAPTAEDRKRDRDLKALHDMIPPAASVAVSEPEMPHISRLEMRSLRDTTDADYILYGVGGGFSGGSNAERVLAAGEFERVAERPGLALLRRKATTTPFPTIPAPPPAHPPSAGPPAPKPPKP